MSTSFAYYTAQESEQFTFYRIPKALFTDPTFSHLSAEAKLLYGLMLDRMGLSRRSGWIDRQGRVYIYFTHTEIQDCLQCGHNKAVRLLKELDQGLGLIRRKRQGLGRPDRIYVMNFVSTQTSQNRSSETPGVQELPGTENQLSENGNSDPETSCFETSASPENSAADIPKGETNKTDLKQKESSDNKSIPPIILPERKDEIDGFEEILREKWGYCALLDNYRAETLDSLILLGADILASHKPTTRIGGQELPTQQVQQRLLSLDFTHIDYVLECFQKHSGPVRNVRSYLLTALYNAPTTIDAYVENQFQQHEIKASCGYLRDNRTISS
jgi:hypothetical protein